MDALNKEQVLQASYARIGETFGALESAPRVIFFDDSRAYWPLFPNEYGSTIFVGPVSCVVIGPKGQNVDVVSHELMHAELARRVGYFKRLMEIPAWFDEGLAMQVDYRAKYADPASRQTEFVTDMTTASGFYVAGDETLSLHYSAAKHEVAKILSQIGVDNAFAGLDAVKNGAKFDDIFAEKHEPTPLEPL